MTDEPTPENRPSPGSAPESWAARSLTDRSKAEEDQTDEIHPLPEPRSGPRMWPRVVGGLILLAGVGGAWIWQNPGFVQTSLRSVFPGSSGQNTGAASIEDLETRVARLEQRPPPVDLGPLIQRLNALEARSAERPAGPDLRPLLDRLDALEKQRAVDPAKIDALASQVDVLSGADPAAGVRGKLDDVEHKLGDMERRLGELSATQTKLTGTSSRTERAAQWAAADIALAAGRPLGEIPGAPPALVRFAVTIPPTEAALRLSFDTAAHEALKVSLPDTEGKPFLDRVLARLQDFRLITVRDGDRVVIGNAAAATLARARVLLDAGDLGGAVRTVGSLSGPPAEKMAPWLADASAVQAAREALASLAGAG